MYYTLFTFPLKNTKSSTISQLKKTCKYLGIDYTDLSKSQLISTVTPYYKEILPYRVQININNTFYWINTEIEYKSIIKLKENNYREKYLVTSRRGRFSFIVRYKKHTCIWERETNRIIYPKLEKLLKQIRNIRLYLELQQLYLLGKYMVNNNILLLDIFTYIICLYQDYYKLQPMVINIL
jgi:hypothetical protein